MANTTFSGPVISKNGFIITGPGATVAINRLMHWHTANCKCSCWKNLINTRRRWYLQFTKH
jgi:hypothetical protein